MISPYTDIQCALIALGDLPQAAEAIAILRSALKQPKPFNPDWDRVKALEASLREHMEEIQKWKSLCKQLWNKEMPKTICGPNLEEVLNAAGFYKLNPLTDTDIGIIYLECLAIPVPKLQKDLNIKFARAIEKAHGIS